MNTSTIRRRIGLLAAALLLASFARAETIGPYDVIEAPISAIQIGGGGANFTWVNVVNTPVTVQEAFTGFSVIDDGFINAQGGTFFRMTFSPPVRNNPGPDLVLFDANNDLNVYLVSTSRDDFGQQIVASANTDTGVDRSYFHGGQGPTSFDIYAATIDLTALGVLSGNTVDQVEIFTEGPSNDPLALGVLAPPNPIPALSTWGLLAAGLLLLAAGGWLALRPTLPPLAG